MKMGPGLFWGLILIILGLSIIVKILFHVSVFRIIFGAVFILIGIRILIGRPLFHIHRGENVVMFGERTDTIPPEDGKEYNTVFGKTVYDYRQVDTLEQAHTRVTYNTIFGTTNILLPDSIPVKIKTDAVFSNAVMPNGSKVTFGTYPYNSGDIGPDSQLLEIEAHVVFGSMNIRR